MTEQTQDKPVESAPKTFEQLSHEYTLLCAQIGDRVFKVKLLEKELCDLHAKADEINLLAAAEKSKKASQAPAAPEFPAEGVPA